MPKKMEMVLLHQPLIHGIAGKYLTYWIETGLIELSTPIAQYDLDFLVSIIMKNRLKFFFKIKKLSLFPSNIIFLQSLPLHQNSHTIMLQTSLFLNTSFSLFKLHFWINASTSCLSKEMNLSHIISCHPVFISLSCFSEIYICECFESSLNLNLAIVHLSLLL